MALLLMTLKPYAFKVYESYSNMTRDQRYCLCKWIISSSSSCRKMGTGTLVRIFGVDTETVYFVKWIRIQVPRDILVEKLETYRTFSIRPYRTVTVLP